MDELDTDWRAVAREYRARLHATCWWAAFGWFFAAGIATVQLADLLDIAGPWLENVAAFAWLPIGVAAWWIKNWFEDRADKGLRTP